MWKKILSFFVTAVLSVLFAEPVVNTNRNIRKVHLIQDDAQDYMTSKIYSLKYAQANDLVPFVSGIVMRYNINSVVSSIEYGNNQQLLTVTCPEKMIAYVDDFIAKADRKIEIDGKVPGEIIQGTGITRAVYRPLYRSGAEIVNVMIASVIGEGPGDALYAYDANSNQIYWKDNASNTSYVYQFLTFLDRPSPQITLEFTIYEVRESVLRDIGIEYLAWKNGPGLNLFQTGFQAFGLSSGGSAALSAVSGPLGGFLFAPQFDASFIRMLQQNGKAEITASASMTVSNSNTAEYAIYFNPVQQNIAKQNNDQTRVDESALSTAEGVYHNYAKITGPVVNIHYGTPQQPYPASEAFEVSPYTPGAINRYPGTLFFAYDLQSAAVVERNNVGAELVEVTQLNGNILIPLDKETILGSWEKESEVEQVIGVPWLCEVPILRYLFSTVTTVKEKSKVYVSVNARLLNGAKPEKLETGKLLKLK